MTCLAGMSGRNDEQSPASRLCRLPLLRSRELFRRSDFSCQWGLGAALGAQFRRHFMIGFLTKLKWMSERFVNGCFRTPLLIIFKPVRGNGEPGWEIVETIKKYDDRVLVASNDQFA